MDGKLFSIADFFLIEVLLIYNAVLVSGIKQSDSYSYESYIYIYIYFFKLFPL